jgi:hypothetical protein
MLRSLQVCPTPQPTRFGYSNTVLVDAAGFDERFSKLLRKTGLFVGSKKRRDCQFFAARYEEEPIDAELLELDLVELDPEWVEHPLARAAKMAHFTHLERGGRNRYLLVGFRVPIVEPEGPIQQQHVEPEKA